MATHAMSLTCSQPDTVEVSCEITFIFKMAVGNRESHDRSLSQGPTDDKLLRPVMNTRFSGSTHPERNISILKLKSAVQKLIILTLLWFKFRDIPPEMGTSTKGSRMCRMFL